MVLLAGWVVWGLVVALVVEVVDGGCWSGC